jgi:integrase
VTNEKGRYHLRAWEGVAKKGHYREPPVPDTLASKLEAVEDLNDLNQRNEFVSVHDKTVYRWLMRSTERLEDDTEDEGWDRVDVHDLRRSWTTHILGEGVLQL